MREAIVLKYFIKSQCTITAQTIDNKTKNQKPDKWLQNWVLYQKSLNARVDDRLITEITIAIMEEEYKLHNRS